MPYSDAGFIDRHGYAQSVIHDLDPRAKLLGTMVFVVAVVSHDKYALAALVPFSLFPVVTAVLGLVPFTLMLKRLLIALPFIVVIGIFNPMLDRAPLYELHGVLISRGWVSFGSIVLRGLLCISAVVILAATTSFPRIIEALRAMRVPRAVVIQLTLLYRSLFLLLAEARRMSRARTLRAGSAKNSLRTAASMLSSLLLRTLDKGDALWLAMMARGFQGEMKSARGLRWKTRDSVFLAGTVLLCALFRLLPFTQALGRLWTAP